MNKPKVAILGPGSIGEFHAREFNNCGCNVVAILTTSKETGENKAKKLRDLYHINAKPYWNLDELLEKEELDIVSVCTPSQFHSQQVQKCLEKGLHILCEKPFIFDSDYENYKTAEKLFELSREKGKILTVNTQLVSIIEQIPSSFNLKSISNFSMYMEPPLSGIINLIREAVPHMNSLLIRLIGKGDIKNLRFLEASGNNLEIQFDYRECKTSYSFRLKKERPRKFDFSINNVHFSREAGEDKNGNYRAQMIYDNHKFDLEDPLKISICKFIGACAGTGKPLVSKSEILYNIKLQDFIIRKYLSEN